MNKQVLNFKNQIILLACMFALYSCESIKDQITVDIPFDSFSIQLDDIIVGDDGGTKSAIVRLTDGLNPFYAEQNLAMGMLKDVPADLEKYQSKIVKVKVGSSTSILVTAENGTKVKNFQVKVAGSDIKFSVEDYDFNTEYSDGVGAFIEQILTELVVKNHEVPLIISGETDADNETKLTVTLTVRDGSFTAEALEGWI